MQTNSGTSVLSLNNHLDEAVLSLQADGKVGINTELPEYELDVRGTAGLEGRIGTYVKGKIPADGKWHSILEQLNGCHAFEITAGVGKKQRGKYALIVAQAVSTYGNSKAQIQITQGYYGVHCNQIQLRWAGTTYDYRLEMRTRCDYGDECQIAFYISKLWFNEYMEVRRIHGRKPMKNIHLEANLQEANLIFKALAKLPFEEVYELIGKLNKQANEQLKTNNDIFLPKEKKNQ